MILVCYDGSADAQSAVDRAAALLAGQPATVLTVWEGFASVLARTSGGFATGSVDVEEIDSESEQTARATAQAGAERANAAGLVAQPRAVERRDTIWETILDVADDVDASLIAVGTRGLTGIKSFVLGSVSQALLQHSDRPVIIVPSREVAAQRTEHRR